MRKYASFGWIGFCFALAPGPLSAQLTVTLEVVPGTVVNGNGTVTVEAFIRNDGPDFNILAYQLDLPCSLPGKAGSTGELIAQPANGCTSNADCPANAACLTGPAPRQCNSTAIPNTSDAASGSVPWAFANVAPNDDVEGCGGVGCQGGLRPINQAGCRFSATPNTNEPPYILPGGGARRFLGRVRYRVSTCATGTFNVPYEVQNNPCNNSDLTRVSDEFNQCVSSVNWVPVSIPIPVGRCCEAGQACLDTNQACCASVAMRTFTAGATCAQGCPCTTPTDCDDGLFCTGQETCEGTCRQGTFPCGGLTPLCNEKLDTCVECLTPEDCPDDGNPCTTRTCSPGGVCKVVNNTDPCSDNDECTMADTCNNGTCVGVPRVCNDNSECTTDTCNPTTPGGCIFTPFPVGTPCGDPSDTECTDPDTCNAAGQCAPNNAQSQTPCTPDDNECTRDVCVAGACVHPNVPNNPPTACGSPVDDTCTNPDRCVNGVCQPFNEPDGTPCETDNNVCTTDACVGGVCAHTPVTPGTACGDPSFGECDGADTCDVNGICQPNHAADDTPCAPDGNECTDDVCRSGICAHPFSPMGTPCGDSSVSICSAPDTCDGAGVCLTNHAPNGTACEDGLFCTGDDRCQTGVCVGGANPCPPGSTCDEINDICGDAPECMEDEDCSDMGNPCINPTCVSGQCMQFAKPAGTACGDQTATECDRPNTCSVGGDCLPNFEPAGTACGDPSNTACDDPDTCDGSGVCRPNQATNGIACDDMLFCTVSDSCVNGECIGQARDCGPGMFCNEETSQCLAGQPCQSDTECPSHPTNPCVIPRCISNVCGFENRPNGTTCNDGLFCTVNDTCTSGVCGGSPRNCSDPLECTNDSCDEVNDVCLNVPKTTGTACGSQADTECDNPNTCDSQGQCVDNFEPVGTACGSASNTDCTDPDTCNGAGVCLVNHAPNATPCSSGNFCTVGEACLNGVCGGGISRDCNDGLTCTADSCDEALDRCVNEVVAGFCLIDGVCRVNGAGNPGNACQFCNSSANPTGWSNRPAGAACGSSMDTDCDNPDACDGNGICLTNHEPDDAPCTTDGNDCTRDVCDSGICVHVPEPIGTACGDPTNNPPCNLADTCNGQGTCLPNLAPNNTPCSDGLFCNGAEVCRGGVCSAGEAPCISPAHCVEATDTCLACVSAAECNDNNICTTDTCVSGTCVNTPIQNCDAQSALRGSASKKGSVLAFPNVEIKWIPIQPGGGGVAGAGMGANYVVRQETFLDISNDYPDSVYIQLYFVHGDAPANPIFVGNPPVMIERRHTGWNWVDCSFLLTSDQPTYFAVSSGLPVGCQPWTTLDPGNPPGRPDPDVPGGRMLRGFVLVWAVDRDGNEIRWNHLKGDAIIIDYLLGTAAEYNAVSFQALAAEHGRWSDPQPGRLRLDGIEYENAPSQLLFDFFASTSLGLSNAATGQNIITETDLSLQVLTADLRQDTDGPVTTKAHFDIWNQNEIRLSGTTRCVTCWDQTLLRQYGIPNNLVRSALQTDKGKARIDGQSSPPVCPGSVDAPLLGVAVKMMTFLDGTTLTGFAHSALNLVGQGRETAVIRYDVILPPGEAVDPSPPAAEVEPAAQPVAPGGRR